MKRLSALLLVALTQCTNAARTDQPLVVVSPGPDEVSIRVYMAEHQVGRDKAVKHLRMLQELAEPLNQLRRRYGERLATLDVDDEPVPHVLVGLKGEGKEAPTVLHLPDGDLRVEFQDGYAYTEKEFTQLMDRCNALVTALMPDALGFQGLPLAKMVNIDVPVDDPTRYADAVARIEAALGLKVKLTPNIPRPIAPCQACDPP